MKICVVGIADIPLGKHNLKDPRMDEAHSLVEAQKKVYAQVDVIGEDVVLESDAIVISPERYPDMILNDMEFVETRLGRNPPPLEAAVLEKYKAQLEKEGRLSEVVLTPEEKESVAVHRFHTTRPITVASAEDASNEALMLRGYQEAGFISFLTVGGKENRAWGIRKGATAWEAAGSIHTDIQKGFIRAEIISWADFIEAGGETLAKRAGKLRLELKTYVMQDYDLVNFRFNK